MTQGEVDRVCGDSYQCNFDFVTTLRRDFAVMTKYYQDQFVNMKGDSLVSGKWGILQGPVREHEGGSLAVSGEYYQDQFVNMKGDSLVSGEWGILPGPVREHEGGLAR